MREQSLVDYYLMEPSELNRAFTFDERMAIHRFYQWMLDRHFVDMKKVDKWEEGHDGDTGSV